MAIARDRDDIQACCICLVDGMLTTDSEVGSVRNCLKEVVQANGLFDLVMKQNRCGKIMAVHLPFTVCHAE